MTVNSKTDFSKAPIIVVGANHSGTRGITDVLTQLGSDPGNRIVGPYSENEFFLRLTQEMIQADSGKGWLDSIYDVDFIKDLKDDCRWVPEIRERMKEELHLHFDNLGEAPWHWKCPSASLYLNTWKEIFPDAYIIHLMRDDLAVAESLFRRREQKNLLSAVRFNKLFNKKVAPMVEMFERRIVLQYDEVFDKKHEIVTMLPGDKLNLDELSESFKRFIIFERKLWSRKRNLKTNLWRVFAKAAVRTAGTFQ